MSSEAENYLLRIKDLRQQVSALVSDLSADALNWRPIEHGGAHETNSLAVMVAHIAGSEGYWIGEVVGGGPPVRDRDAEFAFEAPDAAALLRLLEETGRGTRRVLDSLADADLGQAREAMGKTMTVRWCLLHIVDHTALHLGHMQLTYQLWRGGESAASPRWYERLGRKDQDLGTMSGR